MVLADPDDIPHGLHHALRQAIEKIVLTPDADGTDLRIDFYGDFAGLLVTAGLGYAENDEGPAVDTAGPEMSVVAGAGFEPATFRL